MITIAAIRLRSQLRRLWASFHAWRHRRYSASLLIEADLERRSPARDSELERRMRERAQTVLWRAEGYDTAAAANQVISEHCSRLQMLFYSGDPDPLPLSHNERRHLITDEAHLARLRDAGL
jgi:hypothetical protein